MSSFLTVLIRLIIRRENCPVCVYACATNIGTLPTHVFTNNPPPLFPTSSSSSTGRTSGVASRSMTARGQAAWACWISSECWKSARCPCRRRTSTTSSPSSTPIWTGSSPTQSSSMSCYAQAEDLTGCRILCCQPFFFFLHVFSLQICMFYHLLTHPDVIYEVYRA